jgi:hypothetical protein
MIITFKSWLLMKESAFQQSSIYINTQRGKETYIVPHLAAYAQRFLRPQQVSIEWLKANITGSGHSTLHYPPEEGDDHDRSSKTDLSYPILIIKEPNEMWIGDGNHRIYKALHITKQTALPAYIIDAQTLPPPDQM